MARFNLQLRLTHKIIAIGLAGILGLCLIGAIYMAGSISQDRFYASAREAQLAHTRASKLAVLLLESRRAEKDFLLRSEMKYAERHRELSKTIESEIAGLRKDAAEAGHRQVAADAARIADGFKAYAKHFGEIVEGKTRLGLNENSGLEGTLRKSVQGIEAKLREFDEPRLGVTMLMMRRHEKDFMLRRDPKYGEDIKKRAGEFGKTLAASSIPPADRDDILKKLADYQRDFFAWMDAAMEMARDQKATSDAYAAVEPVIDGMIKRVEATFEEMSKANEQSRASTHFQMEISFVLIVLGVSLIAFLVGRMVSRPLAAVTRAMRELALGNFDVVLPGLGRKDEIGEIAGAVEEFKVKAADKARQDVLEKQAEEQRAAERRKAEMHRLADEFQSAVGAIVDTVSSASTELEAAAKSLSHTAENTQSLSSTVAAASGQASANVQSVAVATEELSSSVDEIARQVHEFERNRHPGGA